MPDKSHEFAVRHMMEVFGDAMKRQEQLAHHVELEWDLGGNLESWLEGGDHPTSTSKYISDVTFENALNKTLGFLEVARSQSRKNALDKSRKRLASNPDLLGACVISINENPPYKEPDLNCTDHDIFSEALWRQAVRRSPGFGPIEYGDVCWIGSISCSIDILLRGEDHPRVNKIVSLSYMSILQSSFVCCNRASFRPPLPTILQHLTV
jgi:hypothetical protein